MFSISRLIKKPPEICCKPTAKSERIQPELLDEKPDKLLFGDDIHNTIRNGTVKVR